MRKVLGAAAATALAVGVAGTAVASAPPVKHAKVDVDGYTFTPGTLHIKRGTKVVWKWVDGNDLKHNIYVLHGPSRFHSRTMSSGSFSHLFNRPGKYVLYCRLHPDIMRETVIVK